MGALVVRSMLQYSNKDNDFPIIFRIVMIAPTNKGCEIADHYSSFKILKKILGPNIIHMRTDSNSLANHNTSACKKEVSDLVIEFLKYGKFISKDNDLHL